MLHPTPQPHVLHPSARSPDMWGWWSVVEHYKNIVSINPNPIFFSPPSSRMQTQGEIERTIPYERVEG
jgi:hypothetical protein